MASARGTEGEIAFIHKDHYGASVAAAKIDYGRFRFFRPGESDWILDMARTGTSALIRLAVILGRSYVSEFLFPRRKWFGCRNMTLMGSVGLGGEICLGSGKERVCKGG